MRGLTARFSISAISILILCVAVGLMLFLSRPELLQPPDIKDLYVGTTTLDAVGSVTIFLPPSVQQTHSSFTYQFGGLGAAMPGLFVKSQLHDGQFSISGGIPERAIVWEIIAHRKAQ